MARTLPEARATRQGTPVDGAIGPAAALLLPGAQAVESKERRVERDAALVHRAPRRIRAGRGGPALLGVLVQHQPHRRRRHDELLAPGLDRPGRIAEELNASKQRALGVELAAASALERLLVDAELDLL